MLRGGNVLPQDRFWAIPPHPTPLGLLPDTGLQEALRTCGVSPGRHMRPQPAVASISLLLTDQGR